MAINEEIVTGRKFRKCIDVANKLWQRISFWTMACDVEFADGENAEDKLGGIKEIVNELKEKMSSFNDAKDMIINSALGEALGFTVDTTWEQVVGKIKGIVNRGNLNWSGSNTTYNVPAGYYTGGVLDSRASYTAGYNKGKEDEAKSHTGTRTGSFGPVKLITGEQPVVQKTIQFNPTFDKAPQLTITCRTGDANASIADINGSYAVINCNYQGNPVTNPTINVYYDWIASGI